MKTIIIETVENGWLVRPFDNQLCYGGNCVTPLFVYTDMQALKNDLVKLLTSNEKPSL